MLTLVIQEASAFPSWLFRMSVQKLLATCGS